MKLELLKSVAAFIDTETGDTYPQFVTGEPDMDPGMTMNVAEPAADDWTEALSIADAATVERVFTIPMIRCPRCDEFIDIDRAEVIPTDSGEVCFECSTEAKVEAYEGAA